MRHSSKYHRLPLTTIIIYWLYQLLFPILMIFALFIAAWRNLKAPSHLTRIIDRFGFGPVGPKGCIWFYAASLGEINAARPLVQLFLDNGHDVLVTHLSPAGMEAGEKLFGNHPKVTNCYMPLDFFLMVKIFLYRAQPTCGIVLEIEIWPAMLVESDRIGVPMFMANGNLLERAMPRLKSWKKSGLHMYRLFDHIFTRDDHYAKRYKATGVRSADITITGELKLNTLPNPISISRGRAWRKTWAGEHFTFMISSSVEMEEGLLVQCCVDLLRQIPKMRIVWVPRSPQRFDLVNKKVQKAGLISMKRSDLNDSISKKTQLFIGNTIGEMDLYLGMADIVFVGASFSKGGGHNIVEPLMASCPVVMGPSTYGVDFIAKDAGSAGIFHSFDTPEQMKNFIINIAQSPQNLKQLQAASAKFCEINIGGANRCYEVIKSLT